MLTSKLRSRLLVLSSILTSLLLQGCLGSVQYRSSPGVRTGLHADIVNFSDREINPDKVDELYLEVARLMAINPDQSKPRPQVLVVPPSDIHQKYLALRPSAKTQSGIAVALYIPHENKILIPHFDRTLLSHELAHYFTFQYFSAPRSKWEQIADEITGKIKNNERIIR